MANPGKIEVKDFAEAARIFRDIQQKAENANYSAATSGFLKLLEKGHQGFFSTGIDPNGKPWAPLRPATIAKKGHGIILVDRDPLMDSLTKRSDSGAIRAITDRMAVFGTSVPYAIFHQMGTSRLPIRAPVGVDSKTLDDIVNLTADTAVEQLRK